MPEPKTDESRKDYMERCVPKLIKEGKSADQAVAICSSMYGDSSAEIMEGEFEDGDDDFSGVFAAEDTKKLNKPFRTPGGPKKFSVYVKNDKGNVVKVNFGDPNMSIKRDNPERRKSFRARHNCDNPGPKWKARYWSCKFWSTPSVTKILSAQDNTMEICKEKSVEFSAEITDTGFTGVVQDETLLNDITFSELLKNLCEPGKRYCFEICAEEE